MNSNKYYPMTSDIIEKSDAYVVKAEMAGCKKEDIKMYVQDGTLYLSCTFRQKAEGGGKYIHRERFNGTCQREFYVGEYVDSEKIKAKYMDGILTVSIPKVDMEEIERKNRISIL